MKCMACKVELKRGDSVVTTVKTLGIYEPFAGPAYRVSIDEVREEIVHEHCQED